MTRLPRESIAQPFGVTYNLRGSVKQETEPPGVRLSPDPKQVLVQSAEKEDRGVVRRREVFLKSGVPCLQSRGSPCNVFSPDNQGNGTIVFFYLRVTP